MGFDINRLEFNDISNLISEKIDLGKYNELMDPNFKKDFNQKMEEERRR
jgi:hypothetical protein